MAKYPDECPVFRWEGRDYEARPLWLSGSAYSYVGDIQEFGPDIMPVDGEGDSIVLSEYLPLSMKPLTRAARQLLKWSRQ